MALRVWDTFTPMDGTATACLFPGQGSQRRGMGRQLFERFPGLTATAEAVLGWSVAELCLGDPRRQLKQTEFTQPALFVVDCLAWLDYRQWAAEPAFLAGHSLGEYAALFAADCFDFETGLHLVRKRGELMSRITAGGMAAVLGLPVDRIRRVLDEERAPVDIANLNLPEQTVLAGPSAALEALVEPMEKAGAHRCLILPVSGPFHSRYMEPAARAFADYLRDFHFAEPRLPVVANTTARPYEPGAVAETLVEQIRSPVRWADTLLYLRQQGVSEAEELGPGTVLAKMWSTYESTAAAIAPEPSPAPSGSLPSAEPATAAPLASPDLGHAGFTAENGLRSAYVVGSCGPGVRTPEMVARAAEGGLLAFLDALEPSPPEALDAVLRLRGRGTARGADRSGIAVGIAIDAVHPGGIAALVDLALDREVGWAEANGFRRPDAELCRFRFSAEGQRLMVLVDGPASAERFLAPAPEALVARLLAEGRLTAQGAERARREPVATELCVVPDGASGLALEALLPVVSALRDRLAPGVFVGAGGAIGSTEAVAAAFFLGADFIRTGAINASAVQSGYAASTKHLLAGLELGDTAEAPSIAGFELGVRARVVKKGSLFAARASRLLELYRFHDSLADLPAAEATRLAGWFGRPPAEIGRELGPETGEDSRNSSGKARMAAVFRRYLHAAWQQGFEAEPGSAAHIPCDESLAAFNSETRQSALADPAERDVVAMAEYLLGNASAFLSRRFTERRSR